MSVNDENSRTHVRRLHDLLSSLEVHFAPPDATWESFTKSESYLEYLKLHLIEMTHCVEVELQRRYAVEPIEFGT